MKIIKCKCGKDILVDDEDYNYLSQYSWSCVGKGESVYLMQYENEQPITALIVSVIPPLVTDHKDRDTHNNQKENLRSATQTQNNQNQGIRTDNKSGYKGVYWSKSHYKWRATIMTNNKRRSLGLFFTAVAAAKAYDEAAKQMHGEFAYINFPNEAVHNTTTS